MITEIISLCIASYFFNGCVSQIKTTTTLNQAQQEADKLINVDLSKKFKKNEPKKYNLYRYWGDSSMSDRCGDPNQFRYILCYYDVGNPDPEYITYIDDNTLKINGLKWTKNDDQVYYECEIPLRYHPVLVPFNDNDEISFIKFEWEYFEAFFKNGNYTSITQDILEGKKWNKTVGSQYIYRSN